MYGGAQKKPHPLLAFRLNKSATDV
jgi:hypothetical protein